MPKSTRFEMRMDPEVLAQVKAAATEDGITPSAWIDKAITSLLAMRKYGKQRLSRLEAEKPRGKKGKP